MKEIRDYYINRINTTEKELSEIKKKTYLVGTLRLLIFLLTLFLAIFLKDLSSGALVGIIIVGTVLFFALIFLYHRLQKRKDYLETSLECDNNELKGLELDLSPFDGAPEKIDASHSYSLDIDLFGNNNSLFQLINRTCTNYGRTILIRFVLNTLNDRNKIERRQETIKELGQKPELLHHFLVSGLIKEGNKTDYKEIKEFANSDSFITNRKLWKALSFLVPAVWILAIIFAGLGQISFTLLIWLYLLTLALSESQAKKVNELQEEIGKKVDILKSYSGLIRIIENETFISEGLNKIRKSFLGKRKASQSIRELARLAGELEQRGNMLIHIILNPLLLWDIKKSIEIEQWKEKEGMNLIAWVRNIGKFDAYASLGIFSFNHPDYVLPSFTDYYFQLKGKELGHPLMNPEVCVRNDVSIDKASSFLIITGANMAGKSTYLRTIGVNFILAGMGAPVCAKELLLYPANLVTSLRTSDSLNDNESYFFAELKRLKMIIDRLKEGEKLFIMLDEILKGTNSMDKQKGSLALIRQLIHLQSCGIIATHDLVLGELEKEFPDHIRNFRFEADTRDDELYFSYQLRPGIAQNMNATFLMKKMGITL